ncbi:diaminopimelate epimerase [Geothrix edaphica]|uniref:Diaminopimelate epimerase n=1 Tax=Geothrix edaphica TaxID=2927976 RepID=A0ABQ5PYR6_9BACT|nr:diaminopimelate epimerase [Geothrix edaphica]GLH67296.1 diaminopimelate epimerase [Geothrix edaphica]
MPNDLAFSKFHALGNDYLVIDPTRTAFDLEARLVQALCDRHRGIGSDGLLLGPLPVPGDPQAFGLRIFNPDGSESEKSGNGLRIFARYLLEAGHVHGAGCRIHTTSGTAEVQYLAPDGSLVQVDMGLPAFRAGDIPFTGLAAHLEVLQVPLFLPTGPVTITALSVGNPHCVLFPGSVSAAEAQRLGPRIERHPDFPNRVNVQLVEVVDRRHIRIEIWERGAGYTLASGSSSCAAAAACRRLGLVEDRLRVLMPGGAIDIAFTDQGRILMTGPVQAVYQGRLHGGWTP